MSEAIQGTFRSAAGAVLTKRLWLPTGKPKAVLQLSHGMAEHIDRYDETAKRMNEAGFAVVGHTHLGHGAQAAALGYFHKEGGWDALINDTHTLRVETACAYPDIPYFLLGHSMGSFVVRTYCLQRQKGLAGVILSGTGHFPPLRLASGLMVANVQCALGMAQKPSKLLDRLSTAGYTKRYENVRTKFDWLSVDSAVVDEYIADPYCGYLFTASAYRDMFRGLARLYPSKLDKMEKDIPVFLFAGDMDPVGAYGEGVRKVAEEIRAAGVEDVTMRLYSGGRHEMLNEPEKANVCNDIIRWMEEKMV